MTGPIYVLVKDLFFATKIVKTAQAAGLEVRAFDSAERLLGASRERQPQLVILDCQGLEREAFRLLEGFQADERLAKVPRIGYLPHVAHELKQEMLRAGCEHIYSKSEFTRELENILVKSGDGLSSRI